MKKKTKIILISLFSMLALLITFGVIDYYRTMTEKSPIFTLFSDKSADGKTTVDYGIGYKIIRYYYDDLISTSSDVKYAEYQFLFFKKAWNKIANSNIDISLDIIEQNTWLTEFNYNTEDPKGMYEIFEYVGIVEIEDLEVSFERFGQDLATEIISVGHAKTLKVLKGDIPKSFEFTISGGIIPYYENYDLLKTKWVLNHKKEETKGKYISIVHNGANLMFTGKKYLVFINKEEKQFYINPFIFEAVNANDFDNISKAVCSFIKTFLLKEITNVVKDEYTEVVLYQFQSAEETVKIKTNIVNNLTVGKYYEFVFDNIDDVDLGLDYTIKDIFDKYYLKDYKATDKIGLNQIQDPLCKNE